MRNKMYSCIHVFCGVSFCNRCEGRSYLCHVSWTKTHNSLKSGKDIGSSNKEVTADFEEMNLEDLDSLVENYLRYRNFKRSALALSEEKLETDVKEVEDRQDVVDRIMKSLEKSDSLRLLTLWDTYVIQSLDQHPPEMVLEARVAEFYVHLYCATYPFRSDVLETASSPNVAARYAARSMTIFKHYLELRGKRLLKLPEFTGLKNLHKIAFPPTHPSYQYLFREEWVSNAKDRIKSFLNSFFKPPKLYLDMAAAQNISMMEARELEIKQMYQQREQKLLDFSRSIYDISHDLISTLDQGKSVDKSFLHDFKVRFEQFRAVLEPEIAESDSKIEESKAAREVVKKRRKKRNRELKTGRLPAITDLSYTVVVQDIQSMVGEVEVELKSLASHDRRMTSVDAEVVLQSAMQASALFNSLNDFLRVDISDSSVDTTAIKEKRKREALVLIDNDIFSLKEDGSSHSSPSYPFAIMSAFCSSFNALSSYAARNLSPKEKTFTTGDIKSTYGILYAASCATVYNMGKLFATVIVSISSLEFQSRMKDGSGFGCHQFFSSLCEALFGLPVSSDKTLDNLKIVFLSLVAMLCQDKKHKHTLVKNGRFEWISKALQAYSDDENTGLLSNNIFVLCILISCSILEDSECQRTLIASVKMEKACVAILRVVVKSLVNDADIERSLHIVLLRTICNLLNEKSIREPLLEKKDEFIVPLRARVQANLSLNPVEEVFKLSNDILKYTNSNFDDETDIDVVNSSVDGALDSITISEDYLSKLLLHLPDEANTSDYKHNHPKDSGMKLLVNYTRSHIAEHGCLYDDTITIDEDF